jgi:glycosyltransferase involved in cell wall biosynthesis
MKILPLASFLQGGAGAAIPEIARRQRAAGHAVLVVTSKTAVSAYGNYPAHTQALKDAAVDVAVVDSLFRRDYAANLNVVRFIQQRAGDGPFDVMHTHAAVPSLIGLLAASGTGTAVIQTMHSWGPRKSPMQTQSDVTVLQRLPRIIVPNESARAQLIGFGLDAGRIGLIPYGVSPSADPFDGLDSADADLRMLRDIRRSGRQVVCCIGTVGPRKNQQLLVEALSEIPEAKRPFCMVVGEGAVGPMTLFSRARGVADSVRFCGHKTNARRFLRESDCLVLPSLSEGLPLTVLEAFCDRVPVVVSDIPELADVVRNHQTGLLFTSNDSQALASAIQEMLALTPDERADMRQQAHQEYRARFTANAMADHYMDEYRQLLGGTVMPNRTLRAA